MMIEFRTNPESANYRAAIWYGIATTMDSLIEMQPNHRPDRPYDTPLCRDRRAFFKKRLKTMSSAFQSAVASEAKRLPAAGCSELIEIDAAEYIAGIVLHGGTLCPAGENDFEIIGYNEDIEAFSYDIITNLSSATVAYPNETSERRSHSAHHAKEWRDTYRAHIRAIAELLELAGVTASINAMEAA